MTTIVDRRPTGSDLDTLWDIRLKRRRAGEDWGRPAVEEGGLACLERSPGERGPRPGGALRQTAIAVLTVGLRYGRA